MDSNGCLEISMGYTGRLQGVVVAPIKNWWCSDLRSGVNFINILHAHLSYESASLSFCLLACN